MNLLFALFTQALEMAKELLKARASSPDWLNEQTLAQVQTPMKVNPSRTGRDTPITSVRASQSRRLSSHQPLQYHPCDNNRTEVNNIVLLLLVRVS